MKTQTPAQLKKLTALVNRLTPLAYEVGRRTAHKAAGDPERFILRWRNQCPEAKEGYKAFVAFVLTHR